MVLGSLKINNARIFGRHNISNLFSVSQETLLVRSVMEKAGIEADPFVEPAQVKPLLAEYFGLSSTEQEAYLLQFPNAWDERAKESHAVLHVPQSFNDLRF